MMRSLFVAILFLGLPSMAAIPHGGGGFHVPKTTCLTPEQYKTIHQRLATEMAKLEREGKFPAKMDNARPKLTSPLAKSGQVNGYTPWSLTNFVDHDQTFPGSLQDYNGGARTYDLDSGYNHQGIDLVLWPYYWDMMAKREVAVVAAAPGTIIFKNDGNPDMNCFTQSGLSWNAVYVRHDDNSVAWYGHLATGTLTTKPQGSRIERGEFIGYVGSSGFSSAPHLHFELYDGLNNLNDPFAGPFNQMNDTTWWEDQDAYYVPQITKLLTHSNAPSPATCPEDEVTNFSSTFAKGQTVYMASYFRDQLGEHNTTYRVIGPNNQVIDQWDHQSNAFHYPLSWWFWTITPDASSADGVYKFEAFYQGKVYQQAFAVGNTGNPIFDDFNQSDTSVAAGEAVHVSWETSGVTELYLDNGYGYQKVDGSIVLNPSATTSYTLTAIGPGGTTALLFDIAVKADASNRFFGHVTPDGASFTTDFILANQTNQDLPYLFQPYDAGGFQLDEVTGIVSAGETQHMSKNDLFGTAAVSHFAIQAEANLAISGAYRAASGGSPAHLTDNAISATRWRLYTGDWGFVWDGFAVVNLGDGETEIFVTQYDADGNTVASESLGMLASNAKTLAVVEAMGFQNAPGTHFVIHADQNLAVTALRGQLSDALYLWENRAIAE